MKNFKIKLLSIFFFIFLINYSYSLENKILFKVNNSIVTSLDILNELKYLETINKEFKNTSKKQAFEIAKRSLIREKIKEIELNRAVKKIELDSQFLNKIILNYFKSIQIGSISEFENYFKSMDIDPNMIRNKITIEVMWNQLIYRKYNQSVKINREAILKDLTDNNKQKEFLLYEILFNINANENLNEKFESIKDKIKKTNFSEAALTYSISDSANKGGNLGWIKETSMSTKIRERVQKINVGDYTDPITIPGGFLILNIRDIRASLNSLNLDKEVDSIVIEKKNEQLNQLSNIFFNKVKRNITINEL